MKINNASIDDVKAALKVLDQMTIKMPDLFILCDEKGKYIKVFEPEDIEEKDLT